MKKFIFIFLTIFSLLFLTSSLAFRNISTKRTVVLTSKNKTLKYEENLILKKSKDNSSKIKSEGSIFKTITDFIKEIISFITTILGLVLTVKEFRKKKVVVNG